MTTITRRLIKVPQGSSPLPGLNARPAAPSFLSRLASGASSVASSARGFLSRLADSAGNAFSAVKDRIGSLFSSAVGSGTPDGSGGHKRRRRRKQKQGAGMIFA